MTRAEAQKIAKAARAHALADRRIEKLTNALDDAHREYDAAMFAASAAENDAAEVPRGSIVEVTVNFKAGRDRSVPWIKAGYYESGTYNGEVRIRTPEGHSVVVSRGRYRIVWTPWMGTPRPDLDELNGGASSKTRGGEK